MTHKGFALVDILQPCVSFNKVNTYEWYQEKIYHLGHDHDPENRSKAFEKALEWGDRIPLGLIYRNRRPTYEERIPVISGKPLVKQPFERDKIAGILEEF